MNVHWVIDGAWAVIAIIWLLRALKSKRAVRRYYGPSRVVQMILLVSSFFLVFDETPLGFLSRRFLPASLAASWIGLGITLAGLLFTLWARFLLGGNWSGEITVKQDHELIRAGPYAIVRHPIYSGFLLALLGTAIAFGEIRQLVGLIFSTIGWRLKSLVEERYMTEQFGDE